MNKPYTLAIDQGGQSTRVAVYDALGEQICCFASPCETHHYSQQNTSQVFIEQNAESILVGLQQCLEKIRLTMGDDIRFISAAGFAGQGSSLLCWNSQTGEALTPVLSWQDIRGESYLKNISLTHEQAQIITGLRVSAHYGASKMRWCLEHYESVSVAHENKQLSIGPIVSYVFRHVLAANECGNHLVDPGHAQRTLLWDLQKNNWSQTLLALFLIDEQHLPRCVPHNSYFGDLMLGEHYVPVMASARDQGASLFAHGLPDSTALYINIGTGAFIQRVSKQLTSPEGLLVSPLWISQYEQDKNLYAWEATVNGAASATHFIEQQTGLAITPDIIHQALQLNLEKECCFLNAIGGVSAPYWRTDLNSFFSRDLSSLEKILAWLESIIFQITVNVQLMNTSQECKKIYISGGLSNADLLCQKLADLTQLPVYRYENTDATLQGIAYLAAAMPTAWHSQVKSYEFIPNENSSLKNRYSTWNKCMVKWLRLN